MPQYNNVQRRFWQNHSQALYDLFLCLILSELYIYISTHNSNCRMFLKNANIEIDIDKILRVRDMGYFSVAGTRSKVSLSPFGASTLDYHSCLLSHIYIPLRVLK